MIKALQDWFEPFCSGHFILMESKHLLKLGFDRKLYLFINFNLLVFTTFAEHL